MTCIFLDVSDLPAPEPLEVALDAVEDLDEGNYIHFHHRQFPRLLFEQLTRAGCEYDIRQGEGETCEVFIWKQGDELAASDSMEAAKQFSETDFGNHQG